MCGFFCWRQSQLSFIPVIVGAALTFSTVKVVSKWKMSISRAKLFNIANKTVQRDSSLTYTYIVPWVCRPIHYCCARYMLCLLILADSVYPACLFT